MNTNRTFPRYVNHIYSFFLSEKRRIVIEKYIFSVAIIFFILHVFIIFLVMAGIIPKTFYSRSGTEPNLLSAIYTPFSIILLYEIYLLIYHLKNSATIYLVKQYEIVLLILIRSIFEDLAGLSSYSNGYDLESIHSILWTFGSLIILFLLIFCFCRISGDRPVRPDEASCSARQLRYIMIKKILALLLLALFVILFVSGFFELRNFSSLTLSDPVSIVKEMSNSFFNTFFTALILTDVLLLLFTFDLTENFNRIVRNSGFTISTILLKLSFRAEGGINIAFILIAVSFGVIMLGIDKLFIRKAGNIPTL